MRRICATVILLFILTTVSGQIQPVHAPIVLISDTQAPLGIEKIFRKTHHNEAATKVLFTSIDHLSPQGVILLGDVTSWSAKQKKWKAMDHYLDTLTYLHIPAYALFGNHDLMGNRRKGKLNFGMRFPETVFTGYFFILDSMAFVMLNSNFSKLSAEEQSLQKKWYELSLAELEHNPGVTAIIVACHHAPFSNSRTVGSSLAVQQQFVPRFIRSPKAKLFITGHAHAFEHYRISGKDFLVIGGGGGVQQHMGHALSDLNQDYKPLFHFLTLTREGRAIAVDSYSLRNDFSTVDAKGIIRLEN